MTEKQYLIQIATEGTPEEKKELFAFNKNTPNEGVLLKFQLFAKSNFIRYYKEDDADFHPDMIMNTIKSYRGKNTIDLGFRGDAKTSLNKLVRVFVFLNDQDHFRMYNKVLCRDIVNAKQIVTDVYNMCLELAPIYGDVFQQEGKRKSDETMTSFTMKSGVKFTAGTVGTKQRGHLQDAFRPDWIWFEDIEDKESISSQTITAKVILLCDEAITGLSMNGSWQLTGNYISDTGSVEWFKNKKNVIVKIQPILSSYTLVNGKIATGVPSWPVFTFEKIKALEEDSEDFWGDYMCDPNRSKNKFFDIERIDRDMKNCTQPRKTSGLVLYWSFYQPHHRFGMGSDHSEGIGKDSNTCVVWDFNTGEMVARYANNEIAPDIATHEFARIGGEYGNCTWGPEINNKCGGIVLTTATYIQYPRLYERKTFLHGQEVPSGKYGWETNAKTKNTMYFEFRRDYNDGLIKIYDIELLKEMKAYTNADLQEKTTGLVTRHFDLLTAAVIGWQMKSEDPDTRVAKVQYHDV